jgi:hypothetical protein
MNAFSLGCRVALCSLLLSTSAAFSHLATPELATPVRHAGPLPPALLTAKRIFISNDGADGGLFPHPFSGDSDRGYDQFYAGVQALGRFQSVADPSQADLVLELRLTAPYGPTNANKQNGAADPLPTFRLTIYDRRSHYVLWSLTESIEVAMKQTTHDRNFDEAVQRLVAGFDALTMPQSPPTR